jgi:flagellar motility protein MotE (MotC chaperone)
MDLVVKLKQTELGLSPKLLLKVSSMLKKLNIKDFARNKLIVNDFYSKDLCLIVHTNLSWMGCNNYYPGYNPSANDFFKYLSTLGGYDDTSPRNIEIYNSNDIIPIYLNYEISTDLFNKFLIGGYIKEKNIIMIYYDIFKSDMKQNLGNKLFLTFIDALIEFNKKTPFETVDITEAKKRAIINRFQTEANNTLKDRATSISRYETNISNCRDQFLKEYRNLQVNKETVKAIEKLLENVNDTINKQMEEIKALKFVKSVKLTVKGVKVNIGDVSINYKDKIYFIGEFSILFEPSSIEITNKYPLTSGDKEHHPHIRKPNAVCFGNRETLVYEMLAKNELKKLVYFIYLYLKSYNEDDKFVEIEKFDREVEKIDTEEKDDEIVNAAGLDEAFKRNDDNEYCSTCGEYLDECTCEDDDNDTE